jgi:hypothetical protein
VSAAPAGLPGAGGHRLLTFFLRVRGGDDERGREPAAALELEVSAETAQALLDGPHTETAFDEGARPPRCAQADAIVGNRDDDGAVEPPRGRKRNRRGTRVLTDVCEELAHRTKEHLLELGRKAQMLRLDVRSDLDSRPLAKILDELVEAHGQSRGRGRRIRERADELAHAVDRRVGMRLQIGKPGGAVDVAELAELGQARGHMLDRHEILQRAVVQELSQILLQCFDGLRRRPAGVRVTTHG